MPARGRGCTEERCGPVSGAFCLRAMRRACRFSLRAGGGKAGCFVAAVEGDSPLVMVFTGANDRVDTVEDGHKGL